MAPQLSAPPQMRCVCWHLLLGSILGSSLSLRCVVAQTLRFWNIWDPVKRDSDSDLTSKSKPRFNMTIR